MKWCVMVRDTWYVTHCDVACLGRLKQPDHGAEGQLRLRGTVSQPQTHMQGVAHLVQTGNLGINPV